MLLFGGAGLEYYLTNLKSDVKEHVVQKDAQERIINTSKMLADDLEALQEEIDDHFTELADVHANFQSTAADFDAAGEQLASDQKKLTVLVLDARDAMHAEMTKAEWEAVFQAPEE